MEGKGDCMNRGVGKSRRREEEKKGGRGNDSIKKERVSKEVGDRDIVKIK